MLNPIFNTSHSGLHRNESGIDICKVKLTSAQFIWLERPWASAGRS